MSLLEQLREEYLAAEIDVARAIELEDAHPMEVPFIEQRRDAARRRYDAVRSQEAAKADRRRGPRPRDPMSGQRPMYR